LQVISGINNFDKSLVTRVARAAKMGGMLIGHWGPHPLRCYTGATHIDIACDPELVAAAKEIVGDDVFICVSDVAADRFEQAVRAGADMVEIGNFDGLYEQGGAISREEVLTLTRDTRALLPNTPLSVTVPHTMAMDQQVDLAMELEALGADLIQTEGKFSLDPQQGGIRGAIERAAPTLAATYAIAKAVNIPVMAASGISEVTAGMAIAAGASGVGVGSAVNKLNSDIAMVAVVKALAASVGKTVVCDPTAFALSVFLTLPELDSNCLMPRPQLPKLSLHKPLIEVSGPSV
ncbi:unnamed protein product, partial [Chrysoparadoxa australica]